MPIYEYSCKQCGTAFEELVWGEATPPCPSCESTEVEKQLSRFAVGSGGQNPTQVGAGSCGTCGDPRGPGACALG